MVALDLATGQVGKQPFVVSANDALDADSATVLPYKNQWLAQTKQRISLHADDGALAGAHFSARV